MSLNSNPQIYHTLTFKTNLKKDGGLENALIFYLYQKFNDNIDPMWDQCGPTLFQNLHGMPLKQLN